MLLGAGASVSSGIKSGGQLIELWKQEIYDEEHFEESVKSRDNTNVTTGYSM